MYFISQSNTTISYNEPWPYWICISSAIQTQPSLTMSHGHIGYVFHQPIVHNQSPDEPWPYWICVASANQTQPCLLISHSHIGYVFHQPIKNNHILHWAMAILNMCFIGQSNTTISYNEPWPYWIYVSSANHTQPFLLMSRGQMR